MDDVPDIAKIEMDEDDALVFNKEDRIEQPFSGSNSEEKTMRQPPEKELPKPEPKKKKVSGRGRKVIAESSDDNDDKPVNLNVYKDKEKVKVNVYKEKDNLDDKIVKMKITKDDDATDIDGDFEPDEEEEEMDAVVKGKLGEIKKEVQDEKDKKGKGKNQGKPKAPESIVHFPDKDNNVVNFGVNDKDNNKANKRKLKKRRFST